MAAPRVLRELLRPQGTLATLARWLFALIRVAPSQGEAVMSPAPTPVANVLVVEDEMVLRMRAVDIVEDAGFTAVQAVNADDALSILESRSDIALLFSDIQMPGSMDGLKIG